MQYMYAGMYVSGHVGKLKASVIVRICLGAKGIYDASRIGPVSLRIVKCSGDTDAKGIE